MYPIETSKLRVVYKPSLLAPAVRGLEGLDIQIESGQIFGYIGSNGAGKTTTIKALLGLIRPTSGRAMLFGQNSNQRTARTDIGYLPEAPYFYEYLSGRETLTFYAKLSGTETNAISKRVDEVAENVGITKALDRAVRTYSRGMRQRLGLAQAIIHRPKLLILDEPMSGLDPLGRRDVREIIQAEAEKGTTIFFSSHILSDVETLCDQIGVLADGKLMAIGELEKLAKSRVSAVELDLTGVKAADLVPLGDKLMKTSMHKELLRCVVSNQEAADEAVKLALNAGGHIRKLIYIQESLEDVFARLSSDNSEVQA